MRLFWGVTFLWESLMKEYILHYMELPKFWHVHWTYFICCGRILCKDGQCILIASQMGTISKERNPITAPTFAIKLDSLKKLKEMNDCVIKIQDNDEIMFPNALRARGWTSLHRIKPYMRPTAHISLLNCLWDVGLEVRPYSKKNFKMSLRWSLVNIGNYITFWKILLLLFATECSIFGGCVILQYVFHRVGLLSLWTGF